MPTIQIWVTDYDLGDLGRLKRYLEHQQEIVFEGKAYRMGGRRGKRKRIRRDRINDSYVFREALHSYWREMEEEVTAFEKREGYR